MNAAATGLQRSIGLLGATAVGIGAIVGGGILVLAGVALKLSGPSSIIAFAVNGGIAVLTALSFAEMSATFPESGGAYTFAKKVLSVRAAFGVGWILWFAYIVAGVLYALGFASYGLLGLHSIWRLFGAPPEWIRSNDMMTSVALLATAWYTLSLIRKSGASGQWETWGKVVVFVFLILGGVWALFRAEAGKIEHGLSPFFSGGGTGLLQAMGVTFIALQGFDLIAAVGGEVKDPERTIPRAMLLSLGAALAIYLPLLFIVVTVGTADGTTISEMSANDPDTIMARAVRNYLGEAGYWLVLVAAVLSTLSALNANLLAASRVAHSMAMDRTLPSVIGQVHTERRTPIMAVYASALALAAILLASSDIESAGASASLIFLISFALAHWTSYLTRTRGGGSDKTYRTPFFPLIPVVGGACCAGMAIFQAIAVPEAGAVTLVWLGLGVLLYFGLFANRAQAMDASLEAKDPELVRLRGRSPLVLVPVANPANAPALVDVAHALSPPGAGRVLLLTVMTSDAGVKARESVVSVRDTLHLTVDDLARTQAVLREALTACIQNGHTPEALLTIAPFPWTEIARVARTHRCESLLLGFTRASDVPKGNLERVLNAVDCDVAFLRAPPGWHLEKARRILVPIGGRGGQHEMRARLLGSFSRTAKRKVKFFSVLPEHASERVQQRIKRTLRRLADDETGGDASVEVITSSSLQEAVARQVTEDDLLILGLQQIGSGRKVFGDATLSIIENTDCATIMISHG